MSEAEFFRLYDDAQNHHPHLILEIGYNRVADWGVHIWNSAGTTIRQAPKVVSVQAYSREEALQLAAARLIKAYPEIVSTPHLGRTNHGALVAH
jgi:hypothetical protein